MAQKIVNLKKNAYLCKRKKATTNARCQGKMPEWSIGAVSKTVVPSGDPGFESLSFRKHKERSPLITSEFLSFFRDLKIKGNSENYGSAHKVNVQPYMKMLKYILFHL